MIDTEGIVKRMYPKIIEAGLGIIHDEAAALDALNGYPSDMLEDLVEDGENEFLFYAVQFTDAFDLDLEGLGYEDILRQIQDISDGELVFEDIREDISEETLESGEGTGEVYFKCNGEEYHFTANVYYDWLDYNIIPYLNSILEAKKMEKRIIRFGGMNGNLLTFKKPEFCEKFNALFSTLEAEVDL